MEFMSRNQEQKPRINEISDFTDLLSRPIEGQNQKVGAAFLLFVKRGKRLQPAGPWRHR
jgi:hypothetical protein